MLGFGAGGTRLHSRSLFCGMSWCLGCCGRLTAGPVACVDRVWAGQAAVARWPAGCFEQVRSGCATWAAPAASPPSWTTGPGRSSPQPFRSVAAGPAGTWISVLLTLSPPMPSLPGFGYLAR